MSGEVATIYNRVEPDAASVKISCCALKRGFLFCKGSSIQFYFFLVFLIILISSMSSTALPGSKSVEVRGQEQEYSRYARGGEVDNDVDADPNLQEWRVWM